MEVTRQSPDDLTAAELDVSYGVVSLDVAVAPVSPEPWAHVAGARLRRLGGSMIAWAFGEDKIADGVREARLKGPGYDTYHIGRF